MSHGVEFPSNLSPTSRKYTMGQYPSTTFESLSGISNRIVYGNVRSSSRLSMVFDYLSAANARKLLDCYNDVMKGTDGFVDFENADALKGNSTQGQDKRLIPYFSEDKEVNIDVDLHWKFEKPPTVTSHYMDRYSVTIDLISVVPASQAYTA